MMFIICIFVLTCVMGLPVDNDLVTLYENTNETTDSSEHLWLFKDKILELASLLIRNVSGICPMRQIEYFEHMEKIVLNTLSEIYDNQEALTRVQFYDNIIPPVKVSLEKCIRASSSHISEDELSKRTYPETLLHLDLRNRNDVSKWQDFRPCIRTQIKPNFHPGTIPSTMDVLWQSFLLGYQGCSGSWGTLKEWNFLDVVRQVIVKPLFKRWSTRLIMQSYAYSNSNPVVGSVSAELVDHLSNTGNGHGKNVSYDTLSSTLEKCNVILFLRHTVDPIPCFRDVII